MENSENFGLGRIAGSGLSPTSTILFISSTTTDQDYYWRFETVMPSKLSLGDNVKNVWDTASTLLPLNTWVFLALGTDILANTQYGFRYKLGSSYAAASMAVFKTRNPPSGTFYELTSDAVLQWTKDNYYPHCNCKMRYVRLYTDFVPYSQALMISLALIDPNSKINLIWRLIIFLKCNR